MFGAKSGNTLAGAATPLKATLATRAAATLHWFQERPARGVFLLALIVRLAFVGVASVLTEGYLIPDERQYIELVSSIVSGMAPDEWYPFYGQSFYESTWAFTGPLVLLFEVFGPWRHVAQIYVALAGAAAAGLTVLLASKFLRARYAVVAGLIVAVLPSQVLFSAVVLREAHVWTALALVAYGCAVAMRGTARHWALGIGCAAAGLLALSFLRPQTLLIASWSLAAACLLGPKRGWLLRASGGVALCLLMPMTAGLGVGGWRLTSNTASHLEQTRSTLAQGAQSGFDPAPAPAPPPATSTNDQDQGAGAPAIAERSAAADDGTDRISGISRLPGGLVDVSLRPFPWEATRGAGLLFARAENLGWYALYCLALVGVVAFSRNKTARPYLLFPALFIGMLFGSAALTQGNLGTAFRHREQAVWALALCAAAGGQWLIDRRRSIRGAATAPERGVGSPGGSQTVERSLGGKGPRF